MHTALLQEKKELFSIQQAAKYLKASPTTLRRWDKSGYFSPIRTKGGQRRYTKQQLLTFSTTKKKYHQPQQEHELEINTVEKTYQQEITQYPKNDVSNLYQNNNNDINQIQKASILELFKQVAHIKNPFPKIHIHFSLPAIPFFTTPKITPQLTKVVNYLSSYISSLSFFSRFVFASFFIGFFISSCFFVIANKQSNPQQSVLASKAPKKEVLQSATSRNQVRLGNLTINIPSFFNAPTTFKEPVTLEKDITIQGDFTFKGKKLDLGTGSLTAPNVIYGITAGDGTSISSGQNPTIKNTGVLSLGGSVGALSLKAGDGITIDGLTITNSLPAPSTFKTVTVGSTSFAAGSSTDTLTFTAGTGITLTPDTSNKKVTITSSADSGFSKSSTNVSLSTSTDSVGIGTTTPGSKLEVSGTTQLRGATGLTGLYVSSTGNVGIGTTSPAFNLDVSGDTNISGGLTVSGNLLITGTQAGFIQRNNGTLLPLNITDDLLLGGTATSSALIKLTGTSGGNSFINTGNVGIGTTAPLAKLDVNGAATVSGNLTFSGARTIAATGMDTLTLGNSSTGNLIVNPGGNIGIGTTTPSSYFSVGSSSQFQVGSTGGVTIGPTGNNVTALTVKATSGTGSQNIFDITNSSGTTSYFSINSSGQLSGNAFKLTDINNAVVGTAIAGGWTMNSNTFTYRRNITITNNDGANSLPTNYEVTISLSDSTASQIYSNSQTDGDDLRIDYNGTEIAKNVTSFTSSSIVFTFQLQAAIAASGSDSSNYHIFYGNSALSAGSTYTGNIAIEAADATTNWATSDSTQFPIAIETSSPAPQEGTGSLKLTATVDNIGTFATTNQGQLSAARTNFGFTSPTISSTRYLYVVGGSTDGTAANAQTTVLRTSVAAATGHVGSWTTNANSLSAGVIDATVVAASPPIDGGTGADGAIDLTNGSGAGGCTGTGLSWDAGTSTCTIATATKSTFNFTTITIPSGTTLTTDGPKTTSNFVTIKATGNVTVAGMINLAEKGYRGGTGGGFGPATAGYGPGKGGWSAGGGYGGEGGNKANNGTTCGTSGANGIGGCSYSTEDSGSGGGGWDSGGGAGGGGFKLTSSGSITVSGTITTNGANVGVATTTSAGGGGSGGRVYLVGSNLIVSGSITATGGNGGNAGNQGGVGGGGGGGGRITLEYNGSLDATGSTITANAGTGGLSVGNPGDYGTVGENGGTGTSTTASSSPYLYVLGGKNTSDAAQSGINYAAITTSDGSVGSFSASGTSLPQALFGHQSLVLTISSSNYLYVIGGNNGTTDQTTVYKGTFNTDGSIAAIATTSQTQLGTGISYPALANVSISDTNYIYVIGGLNGSTAQTSVYKGTVDASGNITALTTTSQGTLPVALYGASAYVGTVGSNNYLYVIGGKTTGGTRQTVVYKAAIDASGNVGTFATTAQTQLTTATSNHASFNFTDNSSNQYTYIIGGNTAASSALTTVYKATYTPIDQTTYSVTKTLASSINMSNKNDIQFKVFTPASGGRTGQYLKFEVSEDNSTWRSCDNSGDFDASSVMNITTSGSWQTIVCKTTGLTSAQKDALLYLKYTVNSSSSSQWLLYIDDVDGIMNASTISNTTSGFNPVLGAADLSVNAQGTGAVNINYDANSALSGSGGLKLYDGGIGLLMHLTGTGDASASGALVLNGASSSAALKILDGKTFSIQTSAGGDTGLATKLTLLNNGNFGIGTTTPNGLLDISGAPVGKALFNLNYTGSGQNIFTASSSGTTRFVIGNDGNVGINTSTTLATLDVRGTNTTSPTASISANSNFAGLVVDNRGNGDLFTASSSGLNRFVIKQNGNIGLGTNTPTTFNMEIAGSIGPTADANFDLGSVTRQWNNIYGANIYASGDLVVTGNLQSQGSQSGFWQRTGQALAPLNITDDLILGASATSSALIKLTGTSGNDSWINTGNLGIGNTAPASKLDVNGDFTLSSLSSKIQAVDSSTTNKVGGIRYLYSKPVTITNSSGDTLPQNATYTLIITGADASTIYSQSQATGDDVRIGYNGSETTRVIDIFTSSSIYIRFAIQANIAAAGNDANYTIYWGNSSVSAPTAYSGSTSLDDSNDSGLWTSSESSVQMATDTSTFTQSTGSTKATPSSGNILAFGTADQTQLPSNLARPGVITHTVNGTTYLYMLGGRTGSGSNVISTVYKATIDASANLGAFSTTSQAQLPEKLEGMSVTKVTAGGTNYVYVLGGVAATSDGTTNYRSSAYKATIDDNNNITAFSTASQSQAPDKRALFPPFTATIGGTSYVYILGGDSLGSAKSTVYKSQISSGNLGSFGGIQSLAQHRVYHTAVTATINGTVYLYVIGGNNLSGVATSTVYRSTIDSSGNFSAFSTTDQAQLPAALNQHGSFISTINGSNFLYIIGGTNKSTVYKATIDSSGNVGEFSTTNQAQLPQFIAPYNSVANVTISGTNYLYVMGGVTSGGENISTVYKAEVTSAAGSGVTITKTLPAAVDLSNKNMITFWLQSANANAGSNVVFEFYDATSGQWNTFNGLSLSQTDTWTQQYYDISAIANADKSNVTQIRFRLINDIDGSFNVDLIRAESQLFSGTTSSALGDTTTFSNNIYLNSEALGTLGINYNSGSTGGFTVYNGATTTNLAISNLGNVVLGSAALATTATDGFLYIPTSAGAPTGVPTTYTGRSAFEFDTTNNKLCAYNGTGTPAWKCSAALSDYAEWAPAHNNVEIGDIVSITEEKNTVDDETAPFMLGKSTEAYDKKIFGVVSKYAEESNSANGYKKGNHYKAIALAGRVPVKVSTESGTIKAGDYLTSSSIPGVAMKATQEGQVVGKALESFECDSGFKNQDSGDLESSIINHESTCQGNILVLIQPSYVDPSNTLTLDTNGDVINLTNQINSLTQRLDSLQATLVGTNSASLSSWNATESGMLGSLDSIASLKNDNMVLGVSSTSASLSQQLSLLPEVTLGGNLTVNGRTTLSDLGVTGNVTIGLLSINGLDTTCDTSDTFDTSDTCANGASINTLGGNLMLQPLALGGIDLFNGKVTFDTKGNITTSGTIKANKFEVNTEISNPTIGSATIEQGQTSVIINNPYVTAKSKIFITPTTTTDKVLSIINKKAGQSFTVTIPYQTSSKITFDWWIVN